MLLENEPQPQYMKYKTKEKVEMYKEMRYSRRGILNTVGVAGAAGLAGCIGEEGDSPEDIVDDDDDDDDDGVASDDDDDGDDSPTGRADISLNLSTGAPARDAQWNPYNPRNYEGTAEAIQFDQFAQYLVRPDEWRNVLMDDYMYDPDARNLTITIGDRTWHNGEAMTAEDAVTFFRIEDHLGGPSSDLVSDVELIDDNTFELLFFDEMAEKVFDGLIFTNRVLGPHSKYGPDLEAMDDATDQDAVDDAIENLLDRTDDEPMGNGVFVHESSSPEGHVFTVWEDHPLADDLTFERLTLVEVGHSSPDRRNALMNNEIDVEVESIPQEDLGGFPDHYIETYFPTLMHEGTMIFNHNHEWLQMREVRQGIAHLLSSHDVEEITLYRPADEYPNGLHSFFEEEYFPDADEVLNPYEKDQAQATALFEEAGFERDDGEWYDPNGDRFELEFISPNWDVQVFFAEYLRSELQDFGIDVETRAVEPPQYLSDVLHQAEFDLGMGFWGGGDPYAYFSFLAIFGEHPNTWAIHPDVYGYDLEPEIPMPVGDPDGTPETVDITAKLRELSLPLDEEREHEIIRELAWIFNVDLPVWPQYQRDNQALIANDDRWDNAPADADCYSYRPVYEPAVRWGCIQAHPDIL